MTRHACWKARLKVRHSKRSLRASDDDSVAFGGRSVFGWEKDLRGKKTAG